MKALARLAAKKRWRVAGLMSGTSADGVGVAIVDFRSGQTFWPFTKVRAFGTVPYPRDVRAEVLRVSEPGRATVADLSRLNFVLGDLFARALVRLARRSRIPLSSIDLIGSHGQTVCHLPSEKHPSTLQIGEPCVIAERTGIATVADFRPRDIAAGGEGAPLVPFADYVLFHHPRRTRCVQNIGGIANVTFLRAGAPLSRTRAFDTGPGNMMIDAATQIITGGTKPYDSGGRLAAKGQVNDALLAELMRHPFLRRRPPKSTGREEFGREFTEALFARALRRHIAAADILATLTAFSARSIGDAYRRLLPGPIHEIILCGGGSHNALLVKMIRSEFPQSRVVTMDAFGIHPDAKEAVSFAILARETILGRPSNVPSATGARRAVILGKIIP